MSKLAKVVVVSVGIVGFVTALLGLLYNGMTVFIAAGGAFPDAKTREECPYFDPAFYGMSAACVVCCLGLLFCSVDLIRLRLRWMHVLIGILVFEVVYVFAVGASWLNPTFGRSVGAATGVANGGLMAELGILYPLWAPVALLWARRRLSAETQLN